MTPPRQRTIARPAEVSGFGLFRGADCRLRFLPFEENSGIVFRRIDLPGRPVVRATIDNVIPAERRTVISDGVATVEMIEHVLAALAGLWIDNCLVELDAPEPPVCDGSSLPFVEALLAAGIAEQTAPAHVVCAVGHTGDAECAIEVCAASRCIVGYRLGYPGTILDSQSVSLTITPQSFVNEIAFARTFVLAGEIEALRPQGLGRRATTENVMVIDPGGVRDGTFRRPDECARHKLLDSIGDFALCGSRIVGRFLARRSGHRHNHEIARLLQSQRQNSSDQRVTLVQDSAA